MSIKINIASILLSIVLVLVLYQCSEAKNSETNNNVVVKDLRLFYGDTEYFVKGISYSPEPIGQQQMKTDGTGGTGFCSPRTEFDGRTRSACYYDHYFDGQIHPEGPSNKPYWKDVWDRDFKVMSELGINTVRVYHMSSYTKSLHKLHGERFAPYFVDPNFAEENKPFLDTALNYNMKVIVPVTSEENILVKYSDEDLKRLVEARVEEVGNHDALLMWAVGNELNLYNRPNIMKKVNFVMEYVKQYTKQRWNRDVPVTTAVIDLPKSYNTLATALKVDVFTTNAGYRDVSLDMLWKEDINNDFAGWECISKKYRIPILIGEFGMHDADRITQQRPDWVNQQWKDILEARKKGCIGGIFFEFSDEPSKAPGQQDMGLVKYNVTKDTTTGRSSNEVNAFVPDKLVKKDIIFEAAQKGLDSSPFKQYNFNADVYELTGEKQMKIDEVPADDLDESMKIECKARNRTVDVDVECPTGLNNCQGACYNPEEYHCKNGKLVEGAEVDNGGNDPTPTPKPTPKPTPDDSDDDTDGNDNTGGDENNDGDTDEPIPTPKPSQSGAPLKNETTDDNVSNDDDDVDNGVSSFKNSHQIITQCILGIIVAIGIFFVFV